MKKLLALCTATLMLGGCATPSYNYTPSFTEISEPPLDTVNVAYVGDIMLKQGKYSEHEAIHVPNLIDVSWSYDLYPGYYYKQGEDDNTETYLPNNQPESGRIDKSAIADPWMAVMAYKDKPTICVITVFSAMICEPNAKFERTVRPVMNTHSFQQTLIYSGKVGDKINIGYREFSNSTARPAFNNDVEYDLSSSKTIGYKGARIEVIDATNELIKYRVIRNFNRAVH